MVMSAQDMRSRVDQEPRLRTVLVQIQQTPIRQITILIITTRTTAIVVEVVAKVFKNLKKLKRILSNNTLFLFRPLFFILYLYLVNHARCIQLYLILYFSTLCTVSVTTFLSHLYSIWTNETTRNSTGIKNRNLAS